MAGKRKGTSEKDLTVKRKLIALKLRWAIEEKDVDAVRSHIDFIINQLDNSESSKDTLQQVFALLEEDLVFKQQAYNMLSQHHDSCLLRIADLERQNDILFGWKYFGKWLMRRIRPRALWQ